MPLPWKKNKVLGISRLVAGINQTPKRGGSLVVETGFPTSLVDLFVKNKDRLKKTSKKKNKPPHLEISNPVLVPTQWHSPVGAGCHDFAAVTSPSGSESTRAGDEMRSGPSAHVEEVVAVEECDGGGRGGSKRTSVFVAFSKVFVVVALALSTKRLAVGITMSAFLLLLLEYAGPQLLIFLKPCSRARNFFVSYAKKAKFLSLSNSNNDDAASLNNIQRFEEKVDSSKDLCGPCEVVKEIELNSSVEEIQAVDSNSEMENRETIVAEYDGKHDILIGEKEPSKRSKIRAKIVKKFGKLRKTKKGKKGKEKEMESSSEMLCYGDDDRFGRDYGGCQEKQVCGEKMLSIQLEEDEDKCKGLEVSDDSSSSFGTQSLASVEEIVEYDRKGNSGYLILFLIVLAGLLGGRFLALVITVAWCLVSKLVERLKPVPIST